MIRQELQEACLELQEAYLDWFNNYLTIGKFASDYGLTEQEARLLIDLGKLVHERLTLINVP